MFPFVPPKPLVKPAHIWINDEKDNRRFVPRPARHEVIDLRKRFIYFHVPSGPLRRANPLLANDPEIDDLTRASDIGLGTGRILLMLQCHYPAD